VQFKVPRLRPGCRFGTTPMSSEVRCNGLGTKAKPSVSYWPAALLFLNCLAGVAGGLITTISQRLYRQA
jgi:hypothetical protein